MNNGRSPDVSLPKQITVIAPLRAFAVSRYNVRVIDTKGIDEPPADRPDLRSCLEDPRTITVLCSGFLSAPDPAVVQLLQGAIETGSWSAITQKSLILLLPKNDDAIEVKHDSGELADSSDEGYEIKADKVRDAIRKLGRYDIGRDGFPVIAFNSGY